MAQTKFQPAQVPLPIFRHGTIYAFEQGCTCAACKKAKRDRDRRRALARGGTCKQCGKPTTGSGKGASELCGLCARRERGQRQRGTSEIQNAIFDYLRGGPKTAQELREHVGFASGGATLRNLVKYGYIERISKGVYQLAPQDPVEKGEDDVDQQADQ